MDQNTKTNLPVKTLQSLWEEDPRSANYSAGVKEVFGNRISAAVNIMYKDNTVRFSTLSDIGVAIYISENDKFLDYYFHSSTSKHESIAGQEELDNKGYFSSVLESVQKLRHPPLLLMP